MNKVLLLFAFIFFFNTISKAQVPVSEIEIPKEELRSVWLTTVFGLDWPKSTDVAQQQQSLRVMLDRMKNFGMNAVVFQVVSRGDAIYYSDRLPFPRYFTGTYGVRPSYDPLQFLIDESRLRGLEVHAWFNAFNIGQVADTTMYAASPTVPHVFHENREWTAIDGTGIWLNPGIPAAREWHIANMMEMVNNYDIDAVHFDFIRYPGSLSGDFATRSEYSPGYVGSLADWRRDNVSAFVKAAHDSVKAVKPWVKVGATPVGHYKSSGGWAYLSGHGSVFQDSRRWLKEGYADYIAPQLYWDISPGADAPDFAWLVRDWMGETYDRHVYLGMGPYKSNIFNEMPRQIDSTRYHNAHGQVQFRFQSLTTSPNFSDRYSTKSLVPTMPWISSVTPDAPSNIITSVTGDATKTIKLDWTPPVYDNNGDNLLRYVVYRVVANESETSTIEEIIANPANIRDVRGIPSFSETATETDIIFNYYITSVNRNNVESVVAGPIEITPSVSIDRPQIAGDFRLNQNYPNPFNPSTSVIFEIPNTQQTTLKVYDMTGRLVATLVNDLLPAGQHQYRFDATSLASGVYVYRLESGNFTQTRKMTFIK